MFPCLACSHRHFDFDSLCSHVPDPVLEPRSPTCAVEVLIPPVAAWCSTNLSPSLLYCCLSRIRSFAAVSAKSVIKKKSNYVSKVIYLVSLFSGLPYSHSALHMSVYRDSMPVYHHSMPCYRNGRPVYRDCREMCRDSTASYHAGRNMYRDGTANYRAGRDMYRDGTVSYHDSTASYRDGMAIDCHIIALYSNSRAL